MKSKSLIIKSDRTKIHKINGKNCEAKGDFSLTELPATIPRGRRSPGVLELSWLHDRLSKLNKISKINNVLEYSCGITTWVTHNAIDPNNYICIENTKFRKIIDPVIEIYPSISITSDWLAIPELNYDLVFIDGSSCISKKLKRKYGCRMSVCRHAALLHSENLMSIGSLVVFHDWNHPAKNGGWRKVRTHLEGSEDYELVEAFSWSSKGFGIFRKIR